MGCGCSSAELNINPIGNKCLYKGNVSSKKEIRKEFESKREKIKLRQGNLNYWKENIEEILAKNEKYSDKKFLPNLSSLIPNDENDPSFEKTPKSYLEEYKTYKWLRANEIFDQNSLQIFLGKTKSTDISQGSLGNCYLLVALMGLARCPERIYKLLVTQQTNTIGAYTVKLLIQGQVKYVTVDDFFPCKKNGKLAFSSTRDNELWLSIVEKAWTKINDCCYMKTWLGIPSEALAALSEAPTIYENHKKYAKHERLFEIWEKIKLAFKKKWVVCANTEETKNTEKMGLVENHAYGVINSFEIDIDLVHNYKEFVKQFAYKYPHFTGDSLKLVKIRNPWGCKEWKGDFGNNSLLWTDKLKKEVRFDEDRQEGVFYMTFEDFTHFFPWSFFCKIEEKYFYRYGKVKQSKEFEMVKYTESKKEKRISTNRSKEESYICDVESEMNLFPFCSFFIEVQTKTNCFICLHQPQKRFMQNYLKKNETFKNIPKYKVPIAQIILLEYDEKLKYHRFIKGDFINWEKLHLEVTLEPGEYHIYCRVMWDFPEIDCKLVLSTYAENPLEIYELRHNPSNGGTPNFPYYNLYKDIDFPANNKHWLIQVMKQIAMRARKKEYFCEMEPTSYFSYDIFENSIGFGVFYCENNSNEGHISSILQFENLFGVRILNAEPDDDGVYSFKVPPKSDYLLILEIVDLPWESSVSWSHLKWFEYPPEYLIKHYLDDKEMCEKEEFEKGDIVFSKIKHDGGFLLHIMNISKLDYKCELVFRELENLEIIDEKFVDENPKKIEIFMRKRGFYYIELKWVKKNNQCSLKLDKKFTKI